MYFEDEKWILLKELKLNAVSFPAFIVLPYPDCNRVKLFIFGGIEKDTEKKTFSKKSSIISVVSDLGDDHDTQEL